MSHRFDTAYRFTEDEHWREGARQNLVLLGGRLVVPPTLCLGYLDGSTADDAGALPSVDACGRLTWLRPCRRELMRRYEFGIEEIGILSGTSPVRQMIFGATVIWLLTGDGMERYGANSLQLLGEQAHPIGWKGCGIGSDGGDGIWTVDVDPEGRGRIRHIDCWGRTCCEPIELDEQVGPSPRLATSDDGRSIVVLIGGEPSALLVIDPTGHHRTRRLPLEDVCGSEATTGPPLAFDVDENDRIHLIRAAAQDGASVILDVVALSGAVESRQRLELPPGFGLVTALVGGAVAGTGGLAMLGACDGDQGQETATRVSTFITPALVSPIGVDAGWNRAEVDVVLPPGTSMEITTAATSDLALIRRANSLYQSESGSAGRLVELLESLLPWRDESSVSYQSTGSPNDGETGLAALLDEVDDETLWLRIELRTPPNRRSPSLTGLRVLYPSDSYLNDLPAVYREDATSTSELRKILGPFEVLFDQLDDALASLPGRIDPRSADDDWTAFLLGWLGFPPLGDLEPTLRRELLARASTLLGRRGTIGALDAVVTVVTGGRGHVDDSADHPAAWFLPSADGPAAARLGRNTLVAAQQPPPARPGELLLGQTPLGNGCADPELVLAAGARVVTVRIDIGPEERVALEPIIERLIRVFVPAHCRLSVQYSGIDSRFRTRRLDVDFRLGPDDEDTSGDEQTTEHEGPVDLWLDGLLYSDAHWQLGGSARLGLWELPDPNFKPAVLDHTSAFDHHRQLN